jgi:hypothetical protein
VSSRRGRAVWVVLGLLTATQVGIGAWRAIIMLRGGLAAGVRPLEWSGALGVDLLVCVAIAAVAWWWLPIGPRRDAPGWGVRFLLISWLLTLAHYTWALVTGRLAPLLTWVVLAGLVAVGWRLRRNGAMSDEPPPPPIPGKKLAFGLAAAFFAAYLPHLLFNYSFTDAKVIWACRGFKLAERASLTGILECADPARAPLHAVTLWLGVEDPIFQGRLLPLLMFGAFVLVFYRLVRRVAPQLASWSVVWLLATDHVLKGQISTYTGVPEMLAIVIGLAVIIDERALAPTRTFALLLVAVAGAVVALTRRDGFPEFLVAAGLLIAITRRWREPFVWAGVAAALVAYLSWVFRPDVLQAVPAFPLQIGAGGAGGVFFQAATQEPTEAQRMIMVLHGAQGQVLSHYGYGAFAWGWLIAGIWARSIGSRVPVLSAATLYGIAGLIGWLSTLGAYMALTLLGHSYMGTLFVIRTGFGRHLVHFFPLCLLHASSLAERLVTAGHRELE